MVIYTVVFAFMNFKLEEKILHRMIAGIPWFQSALNFFMNGTLIR